MALVSDTIFSLLIVASGLLSLSTLGFGMAWVRARERAIRSEQRLAAPPPSADDRYARLEQAVESIAGEVEQLSEGQQFVDRLLRERTRAPQHAAP